MNLDPQPASPNYSPEGAGSTEPYAAVNETHIGVVFLVGDRAYKSKKPVSFGFLDFTSRESRQAVCQREVALNSRLAPDVYLGVADVIGPGGSPCDHLVVMRRLPAARRLAHLVVTGAPVDDHLRRLASLLARFHARAERSAEIDAAASRDAVLALWEANAAEMAPPTGTLFDPAVAARVMDLARRYLGGREALFATRVDGGRVCDGHGDLLADDVFCLDDGPRVLDCLEFDDRLRYGDVLSDVAFLAMDLERLGRADLAVAFLDHYRRAAAETWPASLAHHYIAYRAQVRALVGGLRSLQGDPVAAASALQLLGLSAAHLEAGRVRLVIVGGLPGSGKTTVAREISGALDAAMVRSDEVRKALAGIDPLTPMPAPLDQDLYRPEMTAATYRVLLDRARSMLSMGQSVVLDATFSDPTWREAARELACAAGADLDELHCVAPLPVLERRLADRGLRGGDTSDAAPAVARELARRQSPWPTATVIETDRTVDAVREAALDHLGVAGEHQGAAGTPSAGPHP
ncbi:MAG: AAA family ATPase [Acidimicrobiales bacterium]